MAAKPLPDQALLLKLLRYELETGKLYWRQRNADQFSSIGKCNGWNTRCANKLAGCIDPIGYLKVRIFGKQWLAHRLIWKMMTGSEPETIDHINGIRADNRFSNLREATICDNARNTSLQYRSKSGCHGVVWIADKGVWLAQIRDRNGKYIRLGEFENVDDAKRKRKDAERKFGFHPNHGRAPVTQITAVDRPNNASRDSKIRAMRKSGMTLTQIGGRIGIDPSYVRRICLKGEGKR